MTARRPASPPPHGVRAGGGPAAPGRPAGGRPAGDP
jgi:hypothetical protein